MFGVEETTTIPLTPFANADVEISVTPINLYTCNQRLIAAELRGTILKSLPSQATVGSPFTLLYARV